MKRQANALTAVLENWEDVENAIDIYANSAGSALRENEIYLDSWEAKSKAVSSAWNEFVNTFLNSDWIKGFLEGSQEVLSFLTDINGAIPILAGLISGVLVSAILKGTITIEGFNAAMIKANILSGGIPLLIGALTTGAGVLISLAVSASDTSKQIEKLTTKIEEQQKAIDDLNAKEKEATDLYKEYASLMSKSNAYGLTAEEKENLLQISNDLVDTYGLEVQGIDAVTGAYILGTDAINDYVEALRAERLEKQKEQQKTRDKRIKKNIDIAKGNVSESQTDNVVRNIRDGTKFGTPLLTILSDYNDETIQDVIDYAISLEKTISELTEDEIRNALTKSNQRYRNVVNSITKDIISNIQVDNVDMLNSNSESLLTQMLTPYLTTVDWDKFNYKDFEDKVEKFVSEISGTISDVSERISKRQSEISAGTLKLSGYEDMYSALEGQASILKEMLNQGIIDEKSYKEQITQLSQQIANNIGLSMVEISNKFDETDTESKKAFDSIANNLIDLENQLKQGTISSTQYLDSLTTTINNMDFTDVFSNNKEAAQQFFTTLTSKTSNILQDTITQFEAGKISVTEYGDRLSDFAQQQKELSKNAVEEAEALGIEGKELEQIKNKYAETESAIDGAIKKWEELRNINEYLDENIGSLNSATSTISEGYQGFVDGLYSEFTKLSDETRANVIANMQSMEGYASISADNLLSTMQSNVGAAEALASAVASETNGTLNNIVNNGGKVLSALGNAIKKFDFSITFDPNAKFSGGEFDLVKWVKSGGKEGIKLPSITWNIKGSGGKSLQNLGTSLSNLGNSLSTYSNNIDISDYFGSGGSNAKENGNVTDTGKSGGKKDTKETFDWIETKISRLQRSITNFGKTVSATWKSWTDRNSALKSQISAVTSEINLQQQAADKYWALAESVSGVGNYKKLIQNGALDISTVRDENTINAIKQYQEYYENYLSALDAKQDAEDELRNLKQTSADNISTEYDDLMSFIEHEKSMLDSTANILESKGYMASASIYDKLIQYEYDTISKLEEKYKKLNENLNNSGIQQGTEQWNDMKLEILEVEEAILESKNALVEYNNTLQELDWEVFDKLQEKISGITEEADFLIKLMSDEKMFDEGKITEHGQATLGLYVLNYKTYLAQAEEYGQKLEEIREDLENDPYNQTLVDQEKEWTEALRDSILASEDALQSIVDLKQEGYDSLLESLDTAIEKYKDLINEQKNAYDYQKQIDNLTGDVTKYQKITKSLEGMKDTEEGKKLIQEYSVKLKESEEALAEAENEKYLDDLDKLLQNLSDDATEFVSQKMDNVDALVREVIAQTETNTGSILETLKSETDGIGSITSEMEKVWGSDGTFTTSLNSVVKMFEDYFDKLQKESNTKASEIIASTPSGGSSSGSTPPVTSAPAPSSSSSSSSSSSWKQYLVHSKYSGNKSKLNINTSIVDFN